MIDLYPAKLSRETLRAENNLPGPGHGNRFDPRAVSAPAKPTFSHHLV
jgi:hypothetical protein